MSRKSLIVHGDDLGLSLAFNHGIRQSYLNGFLSSTSVRTNGGAFDHAVSEILPDLKDLGVGVHLNIVEGPSELRQKNSLLCDGTGNYNRNFLFFLGQRNNVRLREEIKAEYRQQIEKSLEVTSIDHLNSHQHTSMIPYIFEIKCELAKEYGIKYVRSTREPPHFSSSGQDLYRLLTRYPNFAKYIVLSYFASANERTIAHFGLRSNDHFLGVLYTEIMSEGTLLKGLRRCHAPVTEALFHPCSLHLNSKESYLPNVRDYVLTEYREQEKAVLTSKRVHGAVQDLGFEVTNYKFLESNQSYSKPITSSPPNLTDPKPLNVFLVVDETPFYHPQLLQKLIRDCPHAKVVGATVVELPSGGVLQKYLLKNWWYLGFSQLFWLGVSKYKYILRSKIRRLFGFDSRSTVKETLKSCGIDYTVTAKVNTDEHIDRIKSLDTDVILSSNSLIFSENLINAPKIMTINRHSSLLPSGGGILPAFRALQNRNKFFGVSIHQMIKKVDAGKVLTQYRFPIEEGDTVNSLYEKSFLLSYFAIDKALEKLRKQKVPDFLPPSDEPLQYYSYPKAKDWKEFNRNACRFV